MANLGTATIGDSNDVITIPGNLNVGGETNYTSTNNITIGDNIIELNYGGSQTTSGILTKDGDRWFNYKWFIIVGWQVMIIGKSWKN